MLVARRHIRVLLLKPCLGLGFACCWRSVLIRAMSFLILRELEVSFTFSVASPGAQLEKLACASSCFAFGKLVGRHLPEFF